MNMIRMILAFLLTILRTLLFGWLLALRELFQMLCSRLQDLLARCKLPERLAKTSIERCVKISDPAFKRPDPMIYDQYYLMGQGIAVTWDNPDIHLEQGGVPILPHLLKPDTVYDVIARIWNNSTEAPVVGLPVRFSYLSFGIGTQAHDIGLATVNLGVKGGPGHPAYAKVPWRTPSVPGHYCIQVDFKWIDDINPNNNLGQTNTDIVEAHSPGEFTFQLRNDTRQRQQYRFEVDAYIIPPLRSCDQKVEQSTPPRGTRLAPGTVLTVPPQHDRRNMTLPQGWSVSFDPSNPVLEPGDEIMIRALATPPTSFHGRQAINVHIFGYTGMAGGITVYVDVP